MDISAVTVNTGSIVDSSAITNFDFAICMVCAWLVPRLVRHHRLYHRTLQRSPNWVQAHTPQDLGDAAIAAANDGYAGGNPARAYANTVVNWAMVQAVGFSALFFTGVAILLSTMTNDLDYRTSHILKGISFFVGTFYIFLLSFSAPQWLGVYAAFYESRRIELGTDLPSLAKRARLSTLKTFINIFPLMAPFFCGGRPATIPLSIVIGLCMGFFMCLVIDFGNRTFKNATHLRTFALFLALAMIVASAYLFSYGCHYIENVWGEPKGQEITLLDILAFNGFIVGGVLLHVMSWKVTHDHNKQKQLTQLMTDQSATYISNAVRMSSVTQRPQTFFGSSVSRICHDLDNEHTESSTSFRIEHIRQMDPTEDGGSRYRDTAGAVATTRSRRDEEMQTLVEGGPEQEAEEEDIEATYQPQRDEQATLPLHADKSKTTANNTAPEDTVQPMEQATEAMEQSPRQSLLQQQTPSMRSNKVHFEAMPDDELPAEEESIHLNHQEDIHEAVAASTTEGTCSLVNAICCDLTCGAGGQTKSVSEKAYNCCSWFVWFLIFAISTFFIIVMVGAQHQEATVRANLPRVHEILYGDMNTGAMCAFDNRNASMTRREKVESTQRTFWTPEDAHLANYTILHCGACGKCSNYHDLRLQYATRNVLGQVALQCAKKVMWGGGYQALLDCTMERATFMEPCARCWATDMECTKQNCIWIGIRAFMINSVTNLQVGADDITPATCEEAMCEATEITGYEGFVPCSGASRRRMNVTSTISRPGDQQCQQVMVEWEDFFGPSKGELDYDPSYDNVMGRRR